MFRARCIDETEAKLVARGEAFFHVPGAGHEASAVLNCFLKPDDYLHLHYRDKALMLARGIPPEQFFNALLCNADSHSKGRQMSAHMSNPGLHILSIVAPVGNNALQAVGAAAEVKSRDKNAIILCSMGDGSTQEGEVLEAIAEAVRSHLPVLFFIEDNRFAISTRTKGQTFYSLPGGDAEEFYGLPIHRVDGRDPVAAYSRLDPIVAAVRTQREPALVLFQVERLSSHTNADDERKYRSEDEIRSVAAAADPIKNLAAYLAKKGIAPRDLASIGEEIRAEVESAGQRALKAWTAEPAKEAKKPLTSELAKVSDQPHEANGEAKLTMLEAIREVLNRHLAKDERVTLYGEDIEDPKGDVFGITRGLTKAYPGRVINSALSESTIVGASIGRALAGGRPVAFIQFADFLPLALNQILCELGTMYWRTAGGWNCPVIIMAPCGGFRPGLGPFHAQTMESTLAHAPGLDVFMPSNATDAAGLLNSAFESGRPTVFLYPKVCLNARESLAAANAVERLAPIGKARFLSRGSDLTLVTWGATVSICAKVAEALSAARVSVDLIDLRSISPWDREAVCESAEKTGTLVVVHEDNLTAGFGAEILAVVSESVPKLISVRRITRPDTYVPCRFANQLEVLPSFRRIITGVCELLGLELAWTSGEQTNEAGEFVKAIGSSPADRTVMVVTWKVKPGDIIATGDIVAELEADKAISELASPIAGTVEEILVLAGNSVPVGTPVLKLHSTTAEERLSPTILLQRGDPVVRRKEKPAAVAAESVPKAEPHAAARTNRLVVGLSGVWAAEGSFRVTNEELARRFPNRTAEQIFRLTGIESRCHLAGQETLLDLATRAATEALAGERLAVSDLDAIICSTTTPVEVTPSMACALQARLCEQGQESHLVAYDILAACSGFLYALSSAFNLLQARPSGKVLVVTAEALSQVVNQEDFDTAILFGDAATASIVYGAAHLRRARLLLHPPIVAAKPDPDRVLRVPNPGSGYVEMEGKKVFGEAVRTMLGVLEQACATSGLKLDDLQMIIPHQANGRIIEAVRSRLGPAGERVMNRVRHRGNTSSCTIPLCLSELDDQLKPGQRIGVCAFGGGFTFGAAILEANHPEAVAAPPAFSHSGAFAVPAEAVTQNTVILDVTEDAQWMERARWLTAEAYLALANPKAGLGLEDVYDIVAADVYEETGRSRTFAALTTDLRSGCTKISGTLRIVFGKNDESQTKVPAIDAMNFLQPTTQWPHQEKDWKDTEIAELGRFFIPPRYRTLAMRRAGVDVWLSSNLYKSAARMALTRNIRMIYIIMPPYVTKLFPRIPIHPVETRQRTEDPIAADVFERFSLYWQRSGPRLYFHFPETLGGS